METELGESPEWLKKIQARAWEAELLISGGAILTIIQVSGTLREFILELLQIDFHFVIGPQGVIVGLGIFEIGFIMSLILRAFWLSFIILQRIRPQGIDREKFNLAEPYNSWIVNFDQISNIQRLDKLCSMVFACTFVFGLSYTSLVILSQFSMLVILTPSSLRWLFQNKFIAVPVVIVICTFTAGYFIFLFVDLFSFGYFRKGSRLPKIYYPVYQFFNFICLGFLWRPYLQVIASTFRKKWHYTITLLLIYFVGALLATFALAPKFINEVLDERKLKLAEINTEESHFLDKIPDGRWTSVLIQSSVVTENYLKVFVPYKLSMIEEKSDGYFANEVTLSLDDSIYAQLQWTGIVRINHQKGVETVIDIRNLERKRHILVVKTPTDTTSIPFWKE